MNERVFHDRTAPGEGAPIAVTVDHVTKMFRLYHERNDSLKVTVMRRGRAKYEEFLAVNDVSFEIRKGETFGIIGENGSGKSTLLKTMARIFRPDRGTVSVTGKLSALLELGAGFHPELSGRENVYLNGRLVPLQHELACRAGRVHRRFGAVREIARHAIRVIGVIVCQRDVRRPLAGEFARFARQPERALGVVESLDREHAAASGDNAAVRNSRAITVEWRRDQRPDTVGDFLERPERFARHYWTAGHRPEHAGRRWHHARGKGEVGGATRGSRYEFAPRKLFHSRSGRERETAEHRTHRITEHRTRRYHNGIGNGNVNTARLWPNARPSYSIVTSSFPLAGDRLCRRKIRRAATS